MSCLDNLVKVGRGCEGADSSLTLEDIGIYLSELDKFVTSDYDNGRALGLAKIDSATRIVLNDVSEYFRDKYRVRSVITNDSLGLFKDSLGSEANTNELSGIEIDLCNNNDYLDLYINSVSVVGTETIDTQVVIFDLNTGVLLDTFPISLIEDVEVTIDISSTYKSIKRDTNIGIFLNKSLINSVYKTSLTNKGCATCRKSNPTRVNGYVTSRGIYTNDTLYGSAIADGSGVLASDLKVVKSNIRGENHTSGVSVTYSLQCNHEDWLCTYKNKLVMPIAYKAGMEVMKYALFVSDRMNSKTTLDAEKLQARLVEYENEYDKLFKNLASGINVPKDNNCFICKAGVRSRVMRP